MAASFESISGNGYKKFQIITIIFPQIKCDIKDTLRHKYTTMWQECGKITKWPQLDAKYLWKKMSKTRIKLKFSTNSTKNIFFCGS